MAVAVFAAGLWLALPAAASAHASFVRSDPPDVCGPLAEPRLPAGDPRCQSGIVLSTPPATIRISFSEPVQLLGRGIRVISPSGRPATTASPSASGAQASVDVDASEEGTYVVQWQVTSEDTHPAAGRFAFSVGHASPPAIGGTTEVGQVAPIGLALQTLAHWLHFVGYALAFGGLAFGLMYAAPAAYKLLNPGILLLLLSEPLALLGQTGSLGLDQMLDPDLMAGALASSFGRLLGFRLAIALLLWVLSGAISATKIGRQPAAVAALALGVVLAVIDGFSQHAASFPNLALGLAVDAAHLMAMAVWLGGLAAVILTGRKPSRRAGWLTLATVGLSGVAMAAVHLTSPIQLLQTTYGQPLAGKQVLVLAALALGVFGWRWKGAPKAELAAITLVVGLAGLLVALPPPR